MMTRLWSPAQRVSGYVQMTQLRQLHCLEAQTCCGCPMMPMMHEMQTWEYSTKVGLIMHQVDALPAGILVNLRFAVQRCAA